MKQKRPAAAPMSWTAPGLSRAAASRHYKPSKRVHDVNDRGHQALRKYPRGTFIYLLAAPGSA